MSFQKYTKYKESGVEWLGLVPAHWPVQPLKRHGRLLTEKTDRRGNPVALENIESWTGRHLHTETEFEGDGVAFEAGDILFGKLRPYLAKALVADAAGEAVGDFLVIRADERVEPKFARYQMLSREFISIVDGSTFGSKMPRASWDFVGSMPLPLAPMREQEAIVRFLDRETAKIDALIEEQRRLVQLLREKRQAVILKAVTEGLDPGAPKRDSGVAWLGMVPAHWKVGALRWRATCASGFGLSTELVESESDELHLIPVIGGNGLMGFTHEASLTETVLSVGRVGALCGNVHVISPPSWITDNALVLRPNLADLRVAYIAAVLRVRNLNEISSKTAQPLITGTQVLDQRVPIPTLHEQDAIVCFIESEAAKCDQLIAESQAASSLLRERRAALISAAVTGKIDVRGLAPQPEAVAA